MTRATTLPEVIEAELTREAEETWAETLRNLKATMPEDIIKIVSPIASKAYLAGYLAGAETMFTALTKEAVK